MKLFSIAVDTAWKLAVTPSDLKARLLERATQGFKVSVEEERQKEQPKSRFRSLEKDDIRRILKPILADNRSRSQHRDLSRRRSVNF